MPKTKKRTKTNLVRDENGKGSFREKAYTRKDGSVCRFWTGYLPASDKKRITGTGATPFEAMARAKAKVELYEQKLRPGQGVQVPTAAEIPRVTLADFIETVHFKSLLKNRRKESSMRRYRDMARHICSYVPEEGGLPLGERPIADVKYALLEQFMDEFRNRPRQIESDGDNYAADIRTFLKAVYTRAYNHEVVARNYAASLPVVPRPSKKHLEVKDSDIRKLFHMTSNPSVKAFILLVYEGLTISEALGVMADQIEGNKIRVRRQVTRVSNPIFDPSKPVHPRTNPRLIAALTSSLKRKGRQRTIHLTDETMRYLMASLDKAKTVKVLCDGNEISVQPVIPSRNGGIWQAHHFRATWQKLCKKAGVKMKVHDFRALLTRDEFASGTPLYELSKQLGHADTQTTEQSYLRLASTDTPNLAVSVKRADRFIQKIAVPSSDNPY